LAVEEGEEVAKTALHFRVPLLLGRDCVRVASCSKTNKILYADLSTILTLAELGVRTSAIEDDVSIIEESLCFS
jgi:hypothetical protein